MVRRRSSWGGLTRRPIRLCTGTDRLGDPVLRRGKRARELLVVDAPRVLGRVEVDGDLSDCVGVDSHVSAACVGFDSGRTVPERDERAAVSVVEHGQPILRVPNGECDDSEHRVGAVDAGGRRYRNLARRCRLVAADQLPSGIRGEVIQAAEIGTVFLWKRGAVVLDEEVVVFRALAQQPICIHLDEATSRCGRRCHTGGGRELPHSATIAPLRRCFGGATYTADGDARVVLGIDRPSIRSDNPVLKIRSLFRKETLKGDAVAGVRGVWGDRCSLGCGQHQGVPEEDQPPRREDRGAHHRQCLQGRLPLSPRPQP